MAITFSIISWIKIIKTTDQENNTNNHEKGTLVYNNVAGLDKQCGSGNVGCAEQSGMT